MIVDAIVLAGGRARRLDGADKPGLMIGGRSLLDRALAATKRASARTTVVVGPVPPVAGVLTTVEEPPFGGPVAGVAAGLDLLPSGDGAWVLLLACDVPRAADLVPLLLAELSRLGPDVEGVHLADRDGRPQWLLGIYRRAALDSALGRLGEIRGASVRALLAGLALVAVADEDGLGEDVDTWQDVERARSSVEPGSSGGPEGMDGGREVTDSTGSGEARAEAGSARPPLPPKLDAWIAALCAELGVDPGLVVRTALLDVARDVAHNVARPAAPLSTFVVGLAAAGSGGGEEAVLAAAQKAGALALTWSHGAAAAPDQ